MKNEKMIRVFVHSALLFILNFAFCTFSFAQDTDKLAKLRLAQGFEEAGEWERAVALYEDLNTLEPNNFLFLDGLQRSYTQIKEYGKAINVVRRWLIVQPGDMNKVTTLGGLYYDSGNETAADSVWKSVIAIDSNNAQLYRVVANEMLQHRMYDQCIRTYLDGRSMSKSEAMFADELGNLYTALQQYTSASKEYLRLIKTTPEQLPLVQSRLNAFTAKPEGISAASETVKDELKNLPDNIALHRLYAWLLSEERRYDAALEQYRIIDRLSHADGNELFNFAQRLHQERAYKTASEAFKEIIDEHKSSLLLPYARFGYARALEELVTLSDTTASLSEPQPTYNSAIQLYESIAAEHANPDLAAQSLYRIGVIKFDKLFDLNGALDAFNRLKDVQSTSNISNDAVLKTGDIQIARNDLAGARKEYDRFSKISLVVYQDQAAFKLAELDYFEAKFDSALSILKRFNTNLNTDLANDALQLQYFIQENNSSAPEALTEFAKADLSMRQRKYSESLVQFQDIVEHYSTALLVDDAMMKIGELYLLLKRPNEAMRAFSFIADSIQLSILKDRAQFRIAEICQTVLNNKSQAIDAYEKLLSQFPNSLYAEESRKRIRLLRGDNL
ncbi:MAG: tetratricopeptide repeat protein [Bacteroidota bacterium]|jgi:tetratricopeptide (TPR) repeat protein